MKDLMIEQINRRARLDHGGDFTKAATEHFRDHPGWWQEYKDEVAGVNKRDSVGALSCRIREYRLGNHRGAPGNLPRRIRIVPVESAIPAILWPKKSACRPPRRAGDGP